VIIGRCDNRLKAGAARSSAVDIAVAEARVVRNLRRVVTLPAHERSDMK
jgi:hypothetical protein